MNAPYDKQPVLETIDGKPPVAGDWIWSHKYNSAIRILTVSEGYKYFYTNPEGKTFQTWKQNWSPVTYTDILYKMAEINDKTKEMADRQLAHLRRIEADDEDMASNRCL